MYKWQIKQVFHRKFILCHWIASGKRNGQGWKNKGHTKMWCDFFYINIKEYKNNDKGHYILTPQNIVIPLLPSFLFLSSLTMVERGGPQVKFVPSPGTSPHYITMYIIDFQFYHHFLYPEILLLRLASTEIDLSRPFRSCCLCILGRKTFWSQDLFNILNMLFCLILGDDFAKCLAGSGL